MMTFRLNPNLCVLILLGMVATKGLAAEDGFEPLFDGQTLEGWDGNPKFWRVEDGAITGQTTPDNPTSGNTFLIWRKGPVDNFELRLQYRIVGGNSGIQYRSREPDKWVLSGYQADFDASAKYAGILYEEKARGILALRGKQVVIHEDGRLEDVGTTTDEQTMIGAIKKEEWNDYRVVAQGNHLVHAINGHVTVDVVDNQKEKRSMSGLLGLQLHAGPPMKVQFRQIRLKKLSAAPATSSETSAVPSKKVVFLAGGPSHGYGAHEHYAGCMLLARYLQENVPSFETVVHRSGWPEDGIAGLQGADAVVVFCDGGGGHLLNRHIDELEPLMQDGVGLVCLHYAVEVPEGKSGDALLRWLGGYFELNWSVNPIWTAEFEEFPEHSVARGLRPFTMKDEWYFHMRFRPQMQGVTPILSATPPAGRNWPDGGRSGNPAVRAAIERGEPQHLAWTYERPGGGRGFGFTGGHWHQNWREDGFRKSVLNGIVWAAQGEVPAGGVGGEAPAPEELEAHQDEPKPQS